jgi:hypothetical protein
MFARRFFIFSVQKIIDHMRREAEQLEETEKRNRSSGAVVKGVGCDVVITRTAVMQFYCNNEKYKFRERHVKKCGYYCSGCC